MAKKRVPQGPTQPPAKGLVAVGQIDDKLGDAYNALVSGIRPRVFRAAMRQIGMEHIDVIRRVLDGTETEEVPMVVSDGKDNGSHVEMVTRHPTIMHKLKAIEIVANAGLKGVPQDNDGEEEGRRRGVLRFPVPAEVISVTGGKR